MADGLRRRRRRRRRRRGDREGGTGGPVPMLMDHAALLELHSSYLISGAQGRTPVRKRRDTAHGKEPLGREGGLDRERERGGEEREREG